MFSIKLLLLICLLINSSLGLSIAEKNIFDHVKKDPDIIEDSIFASGKMQKKLKMEDLQYLKKYQPMLLFPGDEESHYMNKKCKSLLIKLACQVQAYWNGQCSTVVIRAYAGHESVALRRSSLHYAGRALDVKLTQSPCTEVEKNFDCATKLREFAWIARFSAKFDFVEVKANHLHISCKRR